MILDFSLIKMKLNNDEVLESPSKKIHHKYMYFGIQTECQINSELFLHTVNFLYIVRQLFKGDNYSREETINH